MYQHHIGNKNFRYLKTIVTLLIYGLVIALAIFLRTYNYSEIMDYREDQGADLLVAHKILNDSYRPLVGPMLSETNFYTPPTYYYLLSVFLFFGTNPVGTSLFFLLLNIASGYMLYKIGRLLVDHWYGLVLIYLFAISAEKVRQARFIWQPYPLIFFLMISLYCLIAAEKQKKTLLLTLSIILYIIAVSIYPSPIVLAPYFFVKTYRILVSIYRNDIHRVLRIFLGSWVFPGLIVYMPQLYFEYTHDFPTFHTILSSSRTLPHVFEVVQFYVVNILVLVNEFFLFSEISKMLTPPFVLCMTGILFVTIMRLDYLRHRIKSARLLMYDRAAYFVTSPILLIGFLSVILYRGEVYPHRLLAFWPFLLLVLGLCVRFMFEAKDRIFTALVLLLIGFYTWGNGVNILWYLKNPRNEYSLHYEVYTFISGDMDTRELSSDERFLIIKKPDNYYYLVSPYLYLFHVLQEYPVQISKHNDIVPQDYKSTPITYLLCSEYQSETALWLSCLQPFMNTNKQSVLVDHKTFGRNTHVYVFQNQHEQ